MRIATAADVGQLVRQARKLLGLTQAELAGASGVGVRFVIELEQGKPTCELQKALTVLAMLGITLTAEGFDA